jgi:hypothetical protein
MILSLLATLATIDAVDAAPADVHDVELRAKYRISFLGFDLARANLIAKVEHGLYALRVGYKTTGLVKVFAAATGDVSATGVIDSAHIMPAEFHEVTKENSREAKVDMTIAQSNVIESQAIPEVSPDPDRVAVRPEDRRGILDPLSAVLIPTAKGKEPLGSACNRTIPVFDGWVRFNIVMTLKETQTLDKGPFKGEAVVCSVRWVPIAGYIPTRSGTKFMMNNKDLDVTLAPIGDTGYVAPIHIGVQTLHGHVDVDATDFTVAKPEPSAAN